MAVILEPYGTPELMHAGVRPHLQTFLYTRRLDRELAAGVPPEQSVLLAVHAQRIVRPRACRGLAATLRRLVAGSAANAVPISRARIRLAAAGLNAVAARLEADGPVAARGVAALRILLSDGSGPLYRTGDGSGPLYRPGAGGDLACRLARILTELEPA